MEPAPAIVLTDHNYQPIAVYWQGDELLLEDSTDVILLTPEQIKQLAEFLGVTADNQKAKQA